MWPGSSGSKGGSASFENSWPELWLLWIGYLGTVTRALGDIGKTSSYYRSSHQSSSLSAVLEANTN